MDLGPDSERRKYMSLTIYPHLSRLVRPPNGLTHHAVLFMVMGLSAWLAGCSSCSNVERVSGPRQESPATTNFELADGRVLGALPDGSEVRNAWSGIAASQSLPGAGEAQILRSADNRSSRHELIVFGSHVQLFATELLALVVDPFDEAVRGYSSIHENATIRALPRSDAGQVVEVVWDRPELATYNTASDRIRSEAVFLLGALYYADPRGHVFQISLRMTIASPEYPELPPSVAMPPLRDWLAQLGSTLRPGRSSGSAEARTLTIPYEADRILVEVPRGWFIDYFDDDDVPFVRIVRAAPLGERLTYIEVERGIAEPSDGEPHVLTIFGEHANFVQVDVGDGTRLLEHVEEGEELSLTIRVVGPNDQQIEDGVALVERMRRERSQQR